MSLKNLLEEEKKNRCSVLYEKIKGYQFDAKDEVILGDTKANIANIKSRLKKGDVGWANLLLYESFFKNKKIKKGDQK